MSDGQFVSYAQHGEDVVLWRALGPRTDVFYVDVGAYHPIHDSVTHALYERGWRGINIEPQAGRIAAFQEDRPEDVNLAVALGDSDGTAQLTVPDNPGWASVLEPAVTGADPTRSAVIEVPLRRLATVLAEQAVDHVDVLKVDVEGAEPAVVRGMLAGPVRPTVCVIEGVAPGLGRSAGDEAVALLVEAGYTHCLFDGLNHYLTTDAELVDGLSLPANPVDEYVTDLVERLLRERLNQTESISALAAENLALREAAGARGLGWYGGVATPQATPDTPVEDADGTEVGAHTGGPDGPTVAADTFNDATSVGLTSAEALVAVEDAGDVAAELPLPSLEEAISASEAGLAIPTWAVGALRAEESPEIEPLIDPALRRDRRLGTFTSLLAGSTVARPEPSPGAEVTRLDWATLAALAPADQVIALYRMILGRATDADGLRGWTGKIDSGESLRAVAQALAGSPEGREQPAGRRARVRAALAAWARAAILEELGLDPAGAGQSYTAGTVAREIFVNALYEVALARRPGAEELTQQLTLLAGGFARDTMIRGFAAHADARARYLGRPRTVRGHLRRWRARRDYLSTFRQRVLTAEARQVALLQLVQSLSPFEPDRSVNNTAGGG